MPRLALATLAFSVALTAVADEASTLPETDPVPTFKQVDKNGDGRINRDESAAIDGFDFARADANEDRVVSRQEFAAAMARGDELLAFARADKNQDGKIDRKEAAAIDGFNFKAADADHDQGLSRAEFRVAMNESRQRG